MFNIDNFGDDLLATAMISLCKNAGWRRIVVPGLSANLAQRLCNVVTVPSPTEAIEESEIAILGGGGYLGQCGHAPYDEASMFLLECTIRACERTRVPLHIIGPGIDRILTREFGALVHRICSYAQEVVVRDRPTARQIESWGVRVTLAADVVFVRALEVDILRIPPSGTPRSASDADFGETGSVLVQAHSHNVARLMADVEACAGERITAFGTNPSIEEARLFREAGFVGEFIPYSDPWTTCALLRSARLVVSEKMHPSLTAYRLRTPSVTISSAAKTIAFHAETERRHRLCAPDAAHDQVRDFIARTLRWPADSFALLGPHVSRADRIAAAVPHPG
ncbi:MAG: polysaccharide pyruvyl transferase family protein [bacterium]|nr:polysaccharide pyruvyl transferase family protein [bacterium]